AAPGRWAAQRRDDGTESGETQPRSQPHRSGLLDLNSHERLLLKLELRHGTRNTVQVHDSIMGRAFFLPGDVQMPRAAFGGLAAGGRLPVSLQRPEDATEYTRARFHSHHVAHGTDVPCYVTAVLGTVPEVEPANGWVKLPGQNSIWFRKMALRGGSMTAGSGPTTRSLIARWGIILGGWTLLGLFYAVEIYLLYSRNSMQAASWRQVIPGALGFWYLWAGLSPLIVKLGRTFRFEGRGWPRSLGVHLVCGILFGLTHDALLLLGVSLYEAAGGKGFMFLQRLPAVFLSIYVTAGVIIYWMI